MPSSITHTVVGLSSSLAISKEKPSLRVVVLSVCCALIVDLDVLTFKLGISYGDFFGHRGFFHSIFFAIFVGFIVATLFFRKEGLLSKNYLFYASYFSVVTATHGILDAFTNGGLGIALLSPFENSRYFFWETPIQVSPFGIKAFLSSRGYCNFTK